MIITSCHIPVLHLYGHSDIKLTDFCTTLLCSGRAAEVLVNSIGPQMSPPTERSTQSPTHEASPAGSPTSVRTTKQQLLQQTPPFVYRESVARLLFVYDLR